ncbi:MAG: hypothetical protein GXY32_08240 [Ruminococcaceae bacterium]|nr:hypothetical protein [Oscillospiraceae bacterium]
MGEPAIKKVLQIGIAVKDIEKTMETWEKVYGVGPWTLMTREICSEVFSDVKYYGKETPFELLIAKADVAGVEIEFLQPVEGTGDNPYSDFIKAHGDGIHHIAINHGEGFRTLVEGRGNPAQLNSVVASKNLFVTYYDLLKDLGLVVEVFNA